MAGEKQEPITLVAVERGFVRGRLIEPGTEFAFNPIGSDGKPRRIPKWAVKKGAVLPAKAKQLNGDLKPLDAQAASKGKREGLADDLAG